MASARTSAIGLQSYLAVPDNSTDGRSGSSLVITSPTLSAIMIPPATRVLRREQVGSATDLRTPRPLSPMGIG